MLDDTRDAPRRDNLLLMLHAAQKQHPETNHVPPADRSNIARQLEMSVAELDGILSFYTMLSPKPRGRYVIRVCDSLSCRIRDSMDVYRCIRERLKIKAGETTSDGVYSLEVVNCLGSCETAPNVMINDVLHTHLNTDGMSALLDQIGGEA